MEKTLNTFQDNFLGEFVEVLCEITILDGDTKIPLAFQGYFIDFDGENFYFGENPLEVKQYVRKNLVGAMFKIEPKSVEDQILDSMDEPEDESELN